MLNPPASAYRYLERFLADEVPVGEFEAGIYASPGFEAELPAGGYLDLLAFDYRQPHADLALATLARALYDQGRPGFLPRDRAYRYACALLDGELPLPQAVHGLANLWYTGYEWAWAEFMGISSEFDDYPDPAQHPLWEPSALAKYLEGWRDRKPILEASARALAREFLRAEFPHWPIPGRGEPA